jgi:hypothetical protein
MINLYNEFKNILGGIVFLVILLAVTIYFKLATWQFILLLCTVQLVISIIKYIRKGLFSLYDLLKGFVTTVLIVYGIRYVYSFGAIGFVVGILLISALILYKKWDKYIQVKRHIESMIWGKSFYDFEQAGEKPPKLKLEV